MFHRCPHGSLLPICDQHQYHTIASSIILLIPLSAVIPPIGEVTELAEVPKLTYEPFRRLLGIHSSHQYFWRTGFDMFR